MRDSQVCIVTGPRIELAITLIERMKRLFDPKAGIYFDTKETVIELNGVRIEAYPSHHLDSMRGLIMTTMTDEMMMKVILRDYSF